MTVNPSTSLRSVRSKSRGLARSHQIAALSDQLARITHFNTEECKALVYLHMRLESNGPLDRLRMRDVFHIIFEITDDVMLDLAFKAFDRDMNGYVDDIEWVQGLSIMLRGTNDELCEWCYFIYDINGDGGLAREELSYCLKGCILPGYGMEPDEAEDAEKEIIEIAMKKLDVDKDGQITLFDFKKAVKMDPLLLVSVGPCLPPARCSAAFLSLITEKFRSYNEPLGRSVFQQNKSKHASKLRLSISTTSYHRLSPPVPTASSTLFTGTSRISQGVLQKIQNDVSQSQAQVKAKEMENDIKRAKALSMSMVGVLPSKTLLRFAGNTSSAQ